MESRKDDFKDDKLRWDLLPLQLIEHIVKVYHVGAKKYGENTWQNLPNGLQRYFAAFMRHYLLHLKGEYYDKETGLPHLSHCAWNAIAMLHIGLKEIDSNNKPNDYDTMQERAEGM